tara:strand:+ start:3950 stop:4279 length:330 start_codon:yes stop_codon:yes gene_type:complete
MPSKSNTYEIGIIIILVISILIVVYAIWTITKVRKIRGDTCSCSGISDDELDQLTILSIVMIIAACVGFFYAAYMLFSRGRSGESSDDYSEDSPSYSFPIRERFTSKSV